MTGNPTALSDDRTSRGDKSLLSLEEPSWLGSGLRRMNEIFPQLATLFWDRLGSPGRDADSWGAESSSARRWGW